MVTLARAVAIFLMPFSVLFAQSHPFLIDSVLVVKNKITITPGESFKSLFLREPVLTFEYDPDVDLTSLDTSVITIPFIAMAAPAVWVSGKVFSVESMDKDLYYSLKRIKAVFKLFYPQISWEGDIIPQTIKENVNISRGRNNEMALMFSGGLDSTSSSIGSFNKKQLLIINRGIDRKFADENTWQNVKAQCKDFAQAYGHKNAFVTFNYRSAFKESAVRKYFEHTEYSWFHNIAHGLYVLSPSAPLLFAKGYDTLTIASSNTIDWPYPWGSHPLIDNNIKFCGINVSHDQDTLTRPDKIGLIAFTTQKNRLPQPKLRVCWADEKGNNCLTCEKCLRTIQAIVSQGQEPMDWGFAVSLDTIKKRTQAYLANRSFDKPALWEWKNTQTACKKNLKNTVLRGMHSEEFISYLEWFSSLKLFEFCDKQKIYLEEERRKPFFSALWQLGSNLNCNQTAF